MDFFSIFTKWKFGSANQLSAVMQSATEYFPEAIFHIEGETLYIEEKTLHSGLAPVNYIVAIAVYLRKHGGVVAA